MELTWDEYFLNMAFAATLRSKDPSTKVGAVIVGPDHGPRSTGYNGFPRNVVVTTARLADQLDHYMEHAERNAIYLMARRGDATDGCTLYSTRVPCVDCARAIVQTGIIRVVLNKSDPIPKYIHPHTKAIAYEISDIILREGGVSVEKIFIRKNLTLKLGIPI